MRRCGWLAGWLRDVLAGKEFAFSHNRFPSTLSLSLPHLMILVFRFCVTSSFPGRSHPSRSESRSQSHYRRQMPPPPPPPPPLFSTFAANVAFLTVHTLFNSCQTCQNPTNQPTTTTTPEDILLEFIVQKSPHIYTVPRSPRTPSNPGARPVSKRNKCTRVCGLLQCGA